MRDASVRMWPVIRWTVCITMLYGICLFWQPIEEWLLYLPLVVLGSVMFAVHDEKTTLR